jgi:lipopolysaccharide transport system ATP-binding protein
VSDIESGDGVIIEIAYRAPQRIASPIFNASIADEDYQMLIDVNTDSKANALPDLQGTGKVTLKIERLDLRPRRYFISVGVYQTEWSHAYDYHWHAYSFEVHAATHQAGVLHVPNRWSLSVDEKPTLR